MTFKGTNSAGESPSNPRAETYLLPDLSAVKLYYYPARASLLRGPDERGP
jgi:hypothetical protein